MRGNKLTLRFITFPAMGIPALPIGRSSGATPGGGIVETRAQALEAALAGAGVALIDGAYVETLVAPAATAAPLPLCANGCSTRRRRSGRFLGGLAAWLTAALVIFAVPRSL